MAEGEAALTYWLSEKTGIPRQDNKSNIKEENQDTQSGRQLTKSPSKKDGRRRTETQTREEELDPLRLPETRLLWANLDFLNKKVVPEKNQNYTHEIGESENRRRRNLFRISSNIMRKIFVLKREMLEHL